MQDGGLFPIIIKTAIFIMSVVIHEISHGYMAMYLGDPTAKFMKRLTLNPIRHMDPVGSVIVPLLTWITIDIPFGWAKPVPYNPLNLVYKKYGPAWVASAGIIANLCIAIIFGLILRYVSSLPNIPLSTFEQLVDILKYIILINIILAVFNAMPIPPLDGSKIFFTFLPYRLRGIQRFMEKNSLILFIALITFMFTWNGFDMLVTFIFKALAGTIYP